MPASHQNGTPNKRRKVTVSPGPAALLHTWPDSPPPGVAFGIGTSLLYQRVPVPRSLSHTDSWRIPPPWGVGPISAGPTFLNTRPSDQPPGHDLGSTQVPPVQGNQGTDVMESDDMLQGHVTDDVAHTWSDGQSAGIVFDIGVSLSYQSVLPPTSLPHTCSRGETFAGVTLSGPAHRGRVCWTQSQHHDRCPQHWHLLPPYPHTLSLVGLFRTPAPQESVR